MQIFFLNDSLLYQKKEQKINKYNNTSNIEGGGDGQTEDDDP